MKLKLLTTAAMLFGLLYSPSVARPDGGPLPCNGCYAQALTYFAGSGGACSVALKWTVFSYDGVCVGFKPECFGSPCEFEVIGEYQSCCDDNRLQWHCGGTSGQGLVPASCDNWSQFANCWVVVDCATNVNAAYAKITRGGGSIERGVLLGCSSCR